MTSAQIRMARAALNWSIRDLSERSGVHRNTITRLEGGADGHGPTIAAIRAALEAEGIEFLNHGQPGVRFMPIVEINSFAELSKCPLERGSFVRIPTSQAELYQELGARGFHPVRSDGKHYVMRRDFPDGAIKRR